jgi:hypothetical protein
MFCHENDGDASKLACCAGGITRRKKKLQKRADAASPGFFVVLAVWDYFEMDILIVMPAALNERVMKVSNIL